MSLILDALNKADQERRVLDDGPSIDVSINNGGSAQPKKKTLLVIAAVVIFITLIVICVLWLNKGDAKTESPQSQNTQAVEQVPSTSQSSRNTTNKNNSLQTSEDEARLSDIRKAYIEAQNQRKSSKRDTPKTVPADIIKPEEASNTDQKSAEIKELYTNPKRETARTEKQVATVEPRTAGARSGSTSRFASTKTIKQLPLRLQDDVPSIMYEAHNYQSRGTSSIVINGKTVRNNARINAKVKLLEITEEGAIFSIDEHEFKLMALSSWINLN